MPLLAVCLGAALIFAEGEFARSLLDAGAVHALDEPSTGQHYNPLRHRVLVPFAHPADRQHGEDDRGGMRAQLIIPLRIGGADALKLVTSQSALALMADTVLIHVEVPVWSRGLESGIAHRGSCAVEQGWLEASGWAR